MNWGAAIAKLMIFLDIGAGIGYFVSGDIRRGIYWIAAAILTGAMTF
jgi:hypothetical protein